MSPNTKIPTIVETNFSIALTNDSASVLSVNGPVAQLLGFDADDFLSKKVSLQTLIHRHDHDIVEALFSNKIEEESGTFNIRIRHADGRIRCIKGHFDKAIDSTQNCVILKLLLQDAKSLWQQRDDQSSMANFNAMMDNTDDYIYFKDCNHVFTGASQTLVGITDPTEYWTDLIGKTDYDVFPEDYADIYYRLEKQVFSGKNIAHEIQKTLNTQGNVGWVDNRKYPMHSKNGDLIGLFGIARDVTDAVIQQQKWTNCSSNNQLLLITL